MRKKTIICLISLFLIVNVFGIIGCGKDSNSNSNPGSKCLIYEKKYDNGKGYYVIVGVNDKDVMNIIIPNKYKKLPVCEIANNAFSNCALLQTVTIGNSVHTIGDYAFYFCSSLRTVNTITNITKIGNYSFYNCSSLTSIVVPSCVTRIGEGAFFNCTSLTSAIIASSITNSSLGDFAFQGCSALTDITIGAGINVIGMNVFSQCYSLSNAIFDDESKWKVTMSKDNRYGFIGGSSVSLVSPSDNAKLLRFTYVDYYWYK